MSQSGPIILVDDDSDDEQMLRDVLLDLGISNPLRYFDDTGNAYHYLKNTSEAPFLIFSDVNMPRQNGIEFKRQIDEDPQLRSKSIPFVFFSTAVNTNAVDTAYKEMTVQGFFQKPSSYRGLTDTVKLIIDYWRSCRHPNS